MDVLLLNLKATPNMPRKPRATKDLSAASTVLVSAQATASRHKALVFISHDTRDAEIAEAFGDLLSDVSVGTLKTFRSSDNLGTSGIAFGDEWYDAIVSKLGEATDVVALLTATSVDRPWILYEAGIAAGKLSTRVIGIAIGLPLSKAVTGPFSQFQNSADDEQSLTKLMLQLLQRNPDAAPRQETVALHVRTFRQKIASILKSKGGDDDNSPPSEEENVAILVEEIKSMLRELPDKLGERNSSRRVTKRDRRSNIRAIEEIAYGSGFKHFENGSAMALLTVISILRDEMPWIYEPTMDFYKLVTSTRTSARIRESASQLHEFLEFSTRGPLSEFVDEEINHYSNRLLHELIDRATSDRLTRIRASASKTE